MSSKSSLIVQSLKKATFEINSMPAHAHSFIYPVISEAITGQKAVIYVENVTAIEQQCRPPPSFGQ